MGKNDYIIFGGPSIEDAEIKEVEMTLRSGWIGTGPKVSKFEEAIRRYVGSRFAIALNSCTAALHLSMIVSGIKPGDEVITTPMTFCATANAIVHAGAKPVFVDIDRDTFNIDKKLIEEKITKKAKAIIPVHMAGRPCNMDIINKLARKYGLVVIEDAAHALGAEYHGKKIGSISDLACFSFYVTKNITTAEGGMITTNNEKYANLVKVYGLHGMSKDAWKRYSDDGYMHYDVIFPGFKYNMTDIQASLGIHQIKRIDYYHRRRMDIWQYYDQQFKDLGVVIPAACGDNIKHALHLYTILIDKKTNGLNRDEFMTELHRRGIGSGVHFRPVHLHTYYRKRFGFKRGDFPVAELIGDRILSLPLSPKLSDIQVEKVAKTVKSIIRKYATGN